MLKISAFYLEKQKSFIPKKNIFRPLSISKQKSFIDIGSQFSVKVLSGTSYVVEYMSSLIKDLKSQ